MSNGLIRSVKPSAMDSQKGAGVAADADEGCGLHSCRTRYCYLQRWCNTCAMQGLTRTAFLFVPEDVCWNTMLYSESAVCLSGPDHL